MPSHGCMVGYAYSQQRSMLGIALQPANATRRLRESFSVLGKASFNGISFEENPRHPSLFSYHMRYAPSSHRTIRLSYSRPHTMYASPPARLAHRWKLGSEIEVSSPHAYANSTVELLPCTFTRRPIQNGLPNNAMFPLVAVI